MYDLADQATGVTLDVSNPNTTPAPTPNIRYDGNGNRMWFTAYEWLDTYTTNNLNQYTLRNSLEGDNPQATPRPTPTPRPSITPAPRPGDHYASYDHNGNMSIGFDASTYVYDAQNRLTQAMTNGATFNFKYDALNRQVWRSVTDQPETFSVWDGWDLIQEYQAANNGAATAAYLYGATGLIADGHVEYSGFHYYYQDASGSTSHVANASGQLLEWYRYDLDGAPFFYDASDNPLLGSNNSVRHLFTGQQWYQDVGLYDLRNRFYSPDIGRFLQPDPIDFDGDPTNLYRYCGNDPVNTSDPSGLWQVAIFGGGGLGLYVTWGKNSGQWNFGVYEGYGRGAAASYNPFDQGNHEAGMNLGALVAAGYGDGPPVGAGGTAFIGQGGNWATTTVRLGAKYVGVSGGFKYDGTWPPKSTGAAIVGGSGGFGGFGFSIYGDQSVPAGPTGTFGPQDIIYFGTNGKVIAFTPGPIVVVAPPIYEGGSYGGPSWGNGVGVFNPAGFNAPYTSNFYNYTGSLPTTLANPFGSWVPSFGVKPLNYSIFGPNNYYSGLDPNGVFGHIYEGNPISAMEGPYIPVRDR